MKFTYKTLGSDDAETWMRLRLEAVCAQPLGFLITEEEARQMSLEDVGKILEFGSSRGVFADGELVGSCGIRYQKLERLRHAAEVGPFFVASQFHGSGAAQALMRGVATEAREAKVERLELHVDSENERAIRFYEKLGFQYVLTLHDHVRIDGQPRSDHLYRLALE